MVEFTHANRDDLGVEPTCKVGGASVNVSRHVADARGKTDLGCGVVADHLCVGPATVRSVVRGRCMSARRTAIQSAGVLLATSKRRGSEGVPACQDTSGDPPRRPCRPIWRMSLCGKAGSMRLLLDAFSSPAIEWRVVSDVPAPTIPDVFGTWCLVQEGSA